LQIYLRDVKNRRGTTSQAAEKGLISREFDQGHPSGAEAHPLFLRLCGTTEVVP
jgi:hypothetical protein